MSFNFFKLFFNDLFAIVIKYPTRMVKKRLTHDNLAKLDYLFSYNLFLYVLPPITRSLE
jgi:hypothetical protein